MIHLSEGRMDSVPDLKLAVEVAHGFIAIHLYSVPVRLPLTHDQIWRGVVEVFMILGHPATKTVYAWTEPREDLESAPKHITMLHLPPVDSPQSAVRQSLLTLN
jgi:hypothetical protein